MILKRIAKDKLFCKWLIRNKDEVIANHCYVTTALQAYRTGKPIEHLQAFARWKKELDRNGNLTELRAQFGSNIEPLYLYLKAQDISIYSYRDYLNACNHLGLDMNLTKNRFPHDFKRWHDIRIDEHHSAVAEANEKNREKLYANFALVANKYSILQKHGKTGYAVVIATSPAELVKEGTALSHCVGKMGYDQKMVRQESLIFFVRNISNPDTPFITIEYSLKSKKILQAYGCKHTVPSEAVSHFINKVWLPYANRTVKKLTA